MEGRDGEAWWSEFFSHYVINVLGKRGKSMTPGEEGKGSRSSTLADEKPTEASSAWGGGTGGSGPQLRHRAGSAPTNMLFTRSLSVPARSRQFVIEHLPEPWQPILLDFLDLLRQKSLSLFKFPLTDGENEDDVGLGWEWDREQQRNYIGFLLVRWAIYLALGALGLGILYVILTESVLQFFLPFYAAFSGFYWFVYWWRKKNLTPFSERHVEILLTAGFCAEFLIALLCRPLKSEVARCALANITPIICFLSTRLFAPLDHSLLETTLTPTFIAAYTVRLFARHTFTLFPTFIRPFLAYTACFLGFMAAKFAPAQKQVVLCAHSESKDALSPTSSPAHGRMGAGGPPPAPSHRFSTLGEADLQRAFATRSSRRTSLPASASSLLRTRAQSNLNEASGMIADMLANRDLPGNVISCLKAINKLLNPQPSVDLHLDLGLPKFVQDPFSGEQLSVSGSSKGGAVTWSTTTSATGVSTVAEEPSRSRSSSFWKALSEEEKEPVSARGSGEKVVFAAHDGSKFDLKDVDSDMYFNLLDDWDFPIFKVNMESPNTVLTKIMYVMFKNSGLFRVFKISNSKFVNFFHALEQGYWNIPYHNRVHASDVSHSCYHLTCHPVSACSSNDGSREPMSTVMSALELMALYTAAAMHDYDHPGKTNAFLVASGDPKAVLYNDRSVLENHHAAASWTLLSKPENYFVDQLDPAEYKRFRFLVTELILATDLKHHFDVLAELNSKLKSGAIDWEQEGDKLMAFKMVIKLSDINSPTKPYFLHKQWTDRIIEEFFAQGDAERELNLPVSPYMNRSEPQVAKLQDSFIAHLVFPMAQAMNEAGLLPILSENSESELLVNLKENHKVWLDELGTEVEEPEPDKSSQDTTEDRYDGEMETIGEEQEDDESF